MKFYRVHARLPGGMGQPPYEGSVDVRDADDEEQAIELAKTRIRRVHGDRRIDIQKVELLTSDWHEARRESERADAMNNVDKVIDQLVEAGEGVGSMSFNEFREKHGHDLGLVILGAGEPLQAWVDGFSDLLTKEGIVTGAPVFSAAMKLTGNVEGDEGRTDLALIFNADAEISLGKLAMWRLRVGHVSWIDDFIDNYGKDYGYEKEEEGPEEEEED